MLAFSKTTSPAMSWPRRPGTLRATVTRRRTFAAPTGVTSGSSFITSFYNYYHGPVPLVTRLITRTKTRPTPCLQTFAPSLAAENMANKGRDRDNTSGYKGVSEDKKRV